jgi:hypothetical protein
MTIRWGDLSIWISGASLLLALSIMLHDRIRQRREQVEAVAAWATIDVESLTLTLHVRNTNTLPIFAVDIDVGVCWNDQDIDPPRWLPAVIYNRYAFARARQRTTWDYVPNPPPHWTVVPPEAAIDECYQVPAPMQPPTNTLATVRRLSLVDTGGRRWLVYPGRAIPPRLVGRIRPF